MLFVGSDGLYTTLDLLIPLSPIPGRTFWCCQCPTQQKPSGRVRSETREWGTTARNHLGDGRDWKVKVIV